MTDVRMGVGAALDDSVEVLRQAIHKFGVDAQVGMAHEEMGELAAALNQWQRCRIPFAVVEEEVADVLVMAMQVALMGEGDSLSRVTDAYRRKVARLEERLAPKDNQLDMAQQVGSFDFWR